MGGSSGGPFDNVSPAKLREIVRKAENKSTVAAFEAELAAMLGTLLGGYNSRDSELVTARLGNLKDLLENEIDGAFDHLFGGSVAKHTYVDGLSDIDSLLVINDTELMNHSPQKALQHMEQILTDGLGGTAKVEHGRMAITVTYADGMVIQLLPAVRENERHLKVPSSRRDDWSKIDPLAFQEVLTRRNQECAGKLVPTIKLAKAINGQLPEPQRLSGYHMESLAIAAFRGYQGDKTTSAMLPFLFERARALVLSPIRDSSGQSVHVDAYLGVEGSEARQAISHVIGRLGRRMRNASAAGSASQWRALFGLDE
ncbi:CBASS oligonucleotide cyclase [Caballeronia sp. 15715]|uniref:CBASS oligonucleotide cyclase n=1 Tax=Caballeronia sp. 15715 TaxID=3391030 RepID=UPI0039E5CB9C